MTYSLQLEQKYVQEYQRLHLDTSFKKRGWIYGYGDGKATANNILYIKDLVEKYNAKSLLDYGCGKAIHHVEKDMYTNIGITDVGLYDPAIPEYATLPNTIFDCTVCVDVLEHIPEQNLDYVFDNIINRTKLFVFFMISCNPAREVLTTGENAHITQRSPEWWINKFKYFLLPTYAIMSHGKHNTYFDLTTGTQYEL